MDPQIKDYIKSEITNRHGGVTSAILKKWLRDNASIVSATVKWIRRNQEKNPFFMFILKDGTYIAPKYLDNIVEIFLGNIVRLLKYFETYH